MTTDLPEYIENEIKLLKILSYLLVDENTYIKSNHICDYYYELTGVEYRKHFFNNDVNRVLQNIEYINYTKSDDSWNIPDKQKFNNYIHFMSSPAYLNELNNVFYI